MIRTIRHKGLRRLFEEENGRDLKPDQVKRIRRALTLLNDAGAIEDVDLMPGMRLHPLKGDLAGFWSISISGNWRIIFRFDLGEVFDVDLVDYH